MNWHIEETAVVVGWTFCLFFGGLIISMVVAILKTPDSR